MTRKHLVTAAFVVLSLTAAGCASSSSGGTTPRPNAVSTLNPNGCSPPPKLTTTIEQFRHAPPLTISPTTYTARIVTNCGTIIMTMDGKAAPHTVNSFAFLSRQGFFTNSPCHRLTTSGGLYVLQCGDPSGTGEGGPGYTLPDENLRHATYSTGTVAMANTGAPHSGGSQFFLVYANSQLPPQYTPFGKITAGIDVLRRVAKAGSRPPGDGSPKQPVVIESIGVTKG